MIQVNKILSSEGLMTIKENMSNFSYLEIKEIESGKIWVNFGGFNGNPKDLWLKVKGTNGSQRRTFIRVGVQTYSEILWELQRRKIEPTKELLGKAEVEAKELQNKIEFGLKAIADFNDKEKAAKYIARANELNSHKGRTYLANKAVKLGAMRNQHHEFRKRLYELQSI